ncbi:MAG: hypothetical protein WAO76_17355 [Georgfuchsia sp.]
MNTNHFACEILHNMSMDIRRFTAEVLSFHMLKPEGKQLAPESSIGRAAKKPTALNEFVLCHRYPYWQQALLFYKAHKFSNGSIADYKLSGAG